MADWDNGVYGTFMCCHHCDLNDDYHAHTYRDDHDDECAHCEG